MIFIYLNIFVINSKISISIVNADFFTYMFVFCEKLDCFVLKNINVKWKILISSFLICKYSTYITEAADG